MALKILIGTARSSAGNVTLTGAVAGQTVNGAIAVLPGGQLYQVPSGSFEATIGTNDLIAQSTPLKHSVDYSGPSPVYTRPDGTTGALPDNSQKDLAGCQVIFFVT